jgi:monovalent cation:H+ antiporter-2, CPA2 family
MAEVRETELPGVGTRVEDLAMAVYLPVMAIVVARGDAETAAVSVAVALAVLGVVLFLALRHGQLVSRLLAARSNESLLLGVVGLTLLVAGLAQWVKISAAVGAFLVGIAPPVRCRHARRR